LSVFHWNLSFSKNLIDTYTYSNITIYKGDNIYAIYVVIEAILNLPIIFLSTIYHLRKKYLTLYHNLFNKRQNNTILDIKHFSFQWLRGYFTVENIFIVLLLAYNNKNLRAYYCIIVKRFQVSSRELYYLHTKSISKLVVSILVP